ncbi:MAG TPA: hypothetical protein VLA31_02715, partial [Burkholderiaceae bacterium]|nr:hypothetical protein [Burkholderiaceae bacterium]
DTPQEEPDPLMARRPPAQVKADLRALLRMQPHGASTARLAHTIGLARGPTLTALTNMGDAYIHEWQRGQPIWRVVDVPENAPKP